MSNQIMISKEDPNRIQVLGLLSIETVADYRQAGYALMEELEGSVVFDLGDANVVGSAAIALLISWQRRAIQLKKSFTIENAPGQLLEMADVSGLRDIITFNIPFNKSVNDDIPVF